MNHRIRTLGCASLLLAVCAAPAAARPHGATAPVAAAHAAGFHGGVHWVARGGSGHGHGHGRYRGHGGHWRHGGSHWGPGLFFGALGLGIGLAAINSHPAYAVPVYPLPAAEPAPLYRPVPPVATAAAPDPVIYPRDGQSAEQTEVDRQACNRWATTQPKALADASVFQRATLACMDGRGYTLR